MRNIRSGNSKFIKDLNQALILNIVRNQDPISRSEIAKMIKLSPAAVSNLTDKLIKEGYIREKGPGSSEAGRKPILLELNPKARFVVGIDLERVNTVKAAITDLRANIICKKKHFLKDTDFSTVVDSIVNIVHELVDASGLKIEKIMGIGIGTPGLLDHHKGKVIYSTYLHWRNVPLSALIEQELDIPVIIDTDTNAPALAEQKYGAGKEAKDLIYITVGPGLGAGIIIDGQIYHGIDGTAGEFGHTIIDPDGPLCSCGNRGCLETMVAEASIIKRATEGIRKGKVSLISKLAQNQEGLITPKIIYEAALKKDKFAVEVIQETGYYLGLGLVSLVNLLNPEVIVIGGDISQVADILLEPVREVVLSRALSVPAQRVRIVASHFGKDAGIIGAATLVLENIFQIPEVSLSSVR